MKIKDERAAGAQQRATATGNAPLQARPAEARALPRKFTSFFIMSFMLFKS